ncbi:MAG: FAD-dependent oxidoreductase [Gammaproteobacteria bacterium]|nr:FAD-dependent oxidoreductase [Gammaproteobacteria bacterium]
MSENPYALLFEPVKIGPVTARNRFYQVPHCSGLGHLRPQAEAAMRGMKAAGGWAVVSNQETEIHPSSDLSPYPEHRLWDEHDIPALKLMTDAVHEHGALAAVELVHNGHHAMNLYSRTPVLAPADMPLTIDYPKQARAMRKSDIKALRQWHRSAALRARDAGFDIVYVYAGHLMTLTQHFLLPEYNTRTDEYGGSLENRTRLVRELLEETREAIGDKCAVAFRFAVDEMRGEDGMQAQEEGRAVVEMLADLPDLWDVNVADWSNDSITTRFEQTEGYQNDYIRFVKTVTNKPVVTVGRLNSPDLMVAMVKQKLVDFIGAARPSIADPFLPEKIREGRVDDIRECIGCNICVSSDNLGIPIRCTQNPTMGEEWRHGWHPEIIEPGNIDAEALVIGAGPAGLECALQLANRGYDVSLAEATETLGGRVTRESQLHGLSAWGRVRDYRVYQLQQKPNVQIFPANALSAEDVLDMGTRNVFVATGCHWRRDGIGRSSRRPIPGLDQMPVYTPDDIHADFQAGVKHLIVYDDDQGYIGGVIADHLASAGQSVTLVTPAGVVSPWTINTLEQERVQSRLLELGVNIIALRTVDSVTSEGVVTRCIYSDSTELVSADGLVLATMRAADTGLYDQLYDHYGEDKQYHLELIGDALAPGLIADAVYSGHHAARYFQADTAVRDRAMFKRELPSLNNASDNL